MLADLLSVAPLTRGKVLRILDLMRKIVDDYVVLFTSRSDETALLPGLFRDLEARIRNEMKRQPAEPQFSAELTRLVQAFEDPKSLSEVRTLHGLKRYLHQKGLRLGMGLISGISPPSCASILRRPCRAA